MAKAKKSAAATALADVAAALPNLGAFAANTPSGKDYIVRDIALADWGRKEIAVAEHEMPGLMSVRKKYAKQKPLKGVRVTGSAHDHPDGGAHRDAGGPRRQGALGLVQYLFNPRPCRLGYCRNRHPGVRLEG
jgi:hypothetical protein